MKSKKLFQNKIDVKKSKIHGFGVFAGKDIRKGEKIEECCFVTCRCEHNVVIDYYFELDRKSALVFGFGSLYNHSENPNADYTFNRKRKVVTFVASRAIKKGEEIFIDYGEEWFKTRRSVKKKELRHNKRSKK